MKYIIILTCFLISACAIKSSHKIENDESKVLEKNNAGNYATVRVIKRGKLFDSNTTWSNIVSITGDDDKVIYKSSIFSMKAVPFVVVPSGKYKIKFTCHNTNGWNDNYMNIEPAAGGDYTVFCLKENRGKTIFGEATMVALHPFFEKTDEVDIKKVEYQKIIENPEKSDLLSELPVGITRVISYYEPASFLGTENRYRYSILINGEAIDRIDSLKYSSIELPNGDYDFEIRSDQAMLKNGAKYKLKANGSNLYIKCLESNLTFMKCEFLKEKPEDFDTKIKPMHIFQY